MEMKSLTYVDYSVRILALALEIFKPLWAQWTYMANRLGSIRKMANTSPAGICKSKSSEG